MVPSEGVPDADSVGWTVMEFHDEKGVANALKTLAKDPLIKVVERVPTRWLTRVRVPSPEMNSAMEPSRDRLFDAELASSASVP